jgi:hypothetical protein
LVTTGLGTLLIALYVLVDDHVIDSAPARRGHPGRLADAGLACLAVAQVRPGARPERHWLRLCYGRLGHLFPYLPRQPGCRKRVKAAAPLICQTTLALAALCPSRTDERRLLDPTPVPCGTSRQAVRRSELAGWAGYGSCAAHSRWYGGLKLYPLSTAGGMPAAWCPASPEPGEREAARELLERAREDGTLRPGMIVLADKGLAGKDIEQFTAREPGILLARPDRRDEKRGSGSPGGMRPWTESVCGTVKDQLSLERHGARTPEGAYARTARQLLALAAATWHNWSIRTTGLRSLITYDH